MRIGLVALAIGAASAAVLLWLPRQASDTQAPGPTDENFASMMAYILPKIDENRWQSIPWQTSLWSAASLASREDKPVLLWAMNGHPLACT